MKHRTEYRVVVSTYQQALTLYNSMLGLAIHARIMNLNSPDEETAWGRIDEAVAGVLEKRLLYELTDTGVVQESQSVPGVGPFVVSGMAPYPDKNRADEALAHAQTLAYQGAAALTGQQMALLPGGPGRPTVSVGSVHVCYHEEGLPCATATSFSVALPEESP